MILLSLGSFEMCIQRGESWCCLILPTVEMPLCSPINLTSCLRLFCIPIFFLLEVYSAVCPLRPVLKSTKSLLFLGEPPPSWDSLLWRCGRKLGNVLPALSPCCKSVTKFGNNDPPHIKGPFITGDTDRTILFCNALCESALTSPFMNMSLLVMSDTGGGGDAGVREVQVSSLSELPISTVVLVSVVASPCNIESGSSMCKKSDIGFTSSMIGCSTGSNTIFWSFCWDYSQRLLTLTIVWLKIPVWIELC